MSQPIWTADIEIDADLAGRTIAECFPAFSRADVRPLGSGWDNAAFIVDGRVVFRFPRRAAWAKLIEREIALLPIVAAHVSRPISVATYVGIATPSFPWTFAGYDVLAGLTGCARDVSDEARAELAEPLGTFLRDVHGVAPSLLIERGLPPDEIGRLDHAKRLAASRERVAGILESGLADDISDFVRWLEQHPAEPIADKRRTVVHGDLYMRHLLLQDGAQLAGIIDWGDIHLGDPAIDLSIAHLVLPEAAHARFRTAYGKIDDRTWRVARYRAIYHAILELDYGIRTEDLGMQRIGLDALRLMR